MQVGRYLLGEPLGTEGVGFCFHATAPDGTNVELRLLSRTKADPTAWAALTRRLRFLALLAHPALLRPLSIDLDHDPPYLVFEPTTRINQPTEAEAVELAGTLAHLLADAHRLGWTLGPDVSLTPRRTATGSAGVDWSGTDPDPVPRTTGDDVARLGELFRSWFAQHESRFRAWSERMTAPASVDRPSPQEVAQWFRSARDQPEVSVAADRTAITDVQGEPIEQAPSSPVEELQPGDRLGRFLLREKLGEGGMGSVFRTDDPVDGTAVAVKVLRPAMAASESARRRFVKEMRLLAALDSPYVTRLIDANVDGERCYLALEFVAGESVGGVVRRGERIPERDALALITDAARGVAAAHTAGIVHRDLKPDNLLLTNSPTGPKVKVTDFGLARQMVQTESMEITRAGTVLGTPLYMPPEQFGAGAVDGRADVYALGATLFHLLAGRPPFPADTLPAIAKAIATEPAPMLDRVNPDVSAATAALVARCLAKNPDDRPPDADALVHDLTRILEGEPTDVAVHPRVPAGADTAREFVFTWELRSSPARLWPYVSNTERLNKATGLPAVQYELRKGNHGMRRFAAARVVGFGMEWEEHPFEWVEGRRLGILREYSRGPFAWFHSVVELIPNGTGTTLKHTLRAQPRGLLGKIAAPIEVGAKARRKLDRVYRRIDAVLCETADEPTTDPFEEPLRSPQVRARLQAGAEQLRTARANPAAITALVAYLETAPDQEVARVRPFALARRSGIDDTTMADVCLRAVGAGLLQLGWDVICPSCRLASARRDTLKELREHENCQACDVAYQPDFAQSVELIFRVHPDIRRADVGQYCAGGPAHSPHVVSQIRLETGERIELDLALSPGRYRLRGPQLPWSLDLPVTPTANTRRWMVNLAEAEHPPVPSLAAGGQVLMIRNDLPQEVIVRVERVAGRDDALTAARAMGIPAFRELFPDELLSPGQLVPASAVTLLCVGLDRSDEWFEEVGEPRGFHLLQSAVRRIEERVATGGGTVVKTVNEAVVASFERTPDAVTAAYQLIESELTDGSRWKASVHRGLAFVATVNGRLDYFGRTAKIAARLLDAARGGQVVLSDAVTSDPAVIGMLRDRRMRLIEVPDGKSGRVLATIATHSSP
jgi:class 3 adenylate cyclase